MADAIKTYNPKEVVVACGTHIVSGYADDSFIASNRTAMVSPKRLAVTEKSLARFLLTTPTR